MLAFQIQCIQYKLQKHKMYTFEKNHFEILCNFSVWFLHSQIQQILTNLIHAIFSKSLSDYLERKTVNLQAYFLLKKKSFKF